MLVDDISSLGGNHNGGDLDIGSDGNLYVSIGDAGTRPAARRRHQRRARPVAAQRQDPAHHARRPAGARQPAVGCRHRALRDARQPAVDADDELPGAVRLGPAQPVPDRVRSQRWRRPLLHQRRRPERPRGGRRGRHRPQLRLEPVRGVLSRRAAGGHHRSVDRLPAVGGPVHHGRGVRSRRVVAGRSRRWLPVRRWRLGQHLPAARRWHGRTTPPRGPRAPAGSPTWCSRSTRPAARPCTTRSTATASCARSSGTVRSRRRPRRTWRSPRSHRRAPTTPAPGSASAAGDVRSDTTRLVDLPPPSASVQAALVNITVTNNAGWGFLEAWAPRSLRPPTSVVNVVQPGEDVANASVVTLDAEGRFVLHATMATDVVVDVLGWFSTTPGTATAGRFVPVDPGRLIDTRQPAGAQLASGSTNAYVEAAGRVDLPVAGQLGVPAAAGVGAAVIVLTALGTSAPQSGFATAHAGGSAAPDASNVNTNGNGDIRANLAVVPVAFRRLAVGDARARRRRARRRRGVLHVVERPGVGERAVHGRRAHPRVRRAGAGRTSGAGRRHADARPRQRRPAGRERRARGAAEPDDDGDQVASTS